MVFQTGQTSLLQ